MFVRIFSCEKKKCCSTERKLLCLFVAVFLLVSMILPVFAEDTAAVEEDYTPPDIPNTNAAVVYTIEEDRVIYEKNSEEVIYPASTVKLMTAILAVEALGDQLDRQIQVPIDAILYVQGNSVKLKYEETVTVRDLLYALICGCANDAANTLAIEIAGSIDDFVIMMNKKAAEIGCKVTHYTNPTGIHHPDMVTTAYETAIIAAYAAHSEIINEYSSIEKYVMPPTDKTGQRIIYNKNCYFATNVEYLYIWSVPRGLNAGYTEEGGYCVATTASKDGLTYVVIAMGSRSDETYNYSYTEAAKLIKWALRSYGYHKVLTTADMICEIPVRLASKVDYVTLFPSELIELYLPNDADLKKDVHLDWTLYEPYLVAPVSENQVAGKLTVYFEGCVLGVYDLITRNAVNRNNFLYILDMAKMMLSTPLIRAIVAVAILAAVGYAAVIVWIVVSRKRKTEKINRILNQNTTRTFRQPNRQKAKTVNNPHVPPRNTQTHTTQNQNPSYPPRNNNTPRYR